MVIRLAIIISLLSEVNSKIKRYREARKICGGRAWKATRESESIVELVNVNRSCLDLEIGKNLQGSDRCG